MLSTVEFSNHRSSVPRGSIDARIRTLSSGFGGRRAYRYTTSTCLVKNRPQGHGSWGRLRDLGSPLLDPRLTSEPIPGRHGRGASRQVLPLCPTGPQHPCSPRSIALLLSLGPGPRVDNLEHWGLAASFCVTPRTVPVHR